MMRNWQLVSMILLWSVASGVKANGQFMEDDDDLGQVGAYGGLGFGGLNTHGWVGASTGEQISKHVMGLIDTSFLPLGDRTLANRPGVIANSRLYDFNFTIHIQIPLKHRWTPYGLAGAALLFNTYRVRHLRADGVIIDYGRNDSKFGFEAGGGARYFIGKDWGVNGEYRYTITTHNFSRILGGVFYEFHGIWPFLPNAGRRGRPAY